MLTALLLLASPTVAAPAAMPLASKDPPVHVWLNSDANYAYGDRAKVYAKSARDGYLIVLRSDGAGRVRVLFPLNPDADQRITGGKKYELKGRGGREAFVTDDTSGHGTVLAAVSESPFRVDEFVQNGLWNSGALSSPRVRDDAESGLLELVTRMKAPGQHFDYDVSTYVVSERYARDLYPYPYAGPGWWGYDPWRGYGRGFGLGFGWRSRDFFGYRRGWRH
ncbi:MAG: DUF4384 domain-containing protein [Gemmatimonadales bacterium]